MEQKTHKINQKNLTIFVIIFVIIAVISIATYALAFWQSLENTELTMRIGNVARVYFETGPNINISNLGPVFDYEKDGESTYFNVTNYTEGSLPINVNLNIRSISENLKTKDFKYVLMSSSDNVNYTKINEGNFITAAEYTTIPLITNYNLDVNATGYFKVIFYIDGNMENSITMQGGTLSAIISVGADEEAGGIEIPAAETIMALASTDNCAADTKGVCPTNSYTAEDGSTQYHDYRYRGAEVDNYVWFNNDMYRIIGVFDEQSHGVEGEYLVKLISANLLTANSWGVYSTLANQASGTYSSYKNDWTGNKDISSTTDSTSPANANILLNQYFYNKTSTSNTYGECINWTYNGSGVERRTFNCSDIVGYGIDSSIRGYIQEATWHLNGYTGANQSKQNFYLCERGLITDPDEEDCMSANSGAYDTSTTGYIGLMYASDYLYASGYYASDDTTNAGDGYPQNKNWLYKGMEWTITPNANSATNAFRTNGYLYSYLANHGHGVRPTFYLKSSVSITSGEGTFENPYLLSM